MQVKQIKQMIENYIKYSIPAVHVLGKVVKVYETAGKANFNNCIYSADVQVLMLDEEGNFVDSEVIIPDVPILSIGVGNNRGIFFLPAVGSIVKISFLYGSWAYPVIDGILPYFSTIPEHKKDDLNVYVPNNYNHSSKQIDIKTEQKIENIKNLWNVKALGVKKEVQTNFDYTGEFILKGNLTVLGNISSTGTLTAAAGLKTNPAGMKIKVDEFLTVYNSHTHTGDSGGTTSQPNQIYGG